MSEADRVVIVGVHGKFGQVFAQRLAQAGALVSGVDLQKEGALPELKHYAQCDLTQSESPIPESLHNANVVLLCVPESVTLRCLGTVLAHVPADALVMDVASVKSNVVELVLSSSYQGEYLSVHPMFGPGADFAGRNLAVVQVRGGGRSETILRLFREWGLSIVELTAGEHDRATAWLQAAAHVTLLAWGEAAQSTGIAPEKLFQLGTPISLGLCAWLRRMHDAGADLYFDLQQTNPYATEMRQHLTERLVHLNELIQNGDRDQFHDAFNNIDSMLGSAGEQLRELATGMVHALRAEMDHE